MHRKIRILYFGLDKANKVGGIETYIRKILYHINRDEFQIDFIAFKGVEPCFYDEFKNLGCNFYFVTSRKESFWKNKKEIRSLLEKEKFDIVHCHLNSLSYITPCIEACHLKIPVIVHSRNASVISSSFSKILHHLNHLRLRYLPIHRVAVSDLAGAWMFGNKQFAVLNNGIDTTQYMFSEEGRNSIRKELAIDESVEVFVNVGAFRPQKNHSFLVRVFAEYLKKKPKSILLLVGEGKLKKEIEGLVARLGIEANVKFLSLRDDISSVLSSADKFLFPSFYEGFPNALLEAECCGLQCIVSDSITKQAMIDGLCETVSLNEPVESWCAAMEKNVNIDRKKVDQIIKKMGLDIDSEIYRLASLYKSMVGESSK